MVKPLTKVKMQPVLVSVQFSLVPCGRSENVERFHLNKMSGQIFQPVEDSSRCLVNVGIIKTCILLSYICAFKCHQCAINQFINERVPYGRTDGQYIYFLVVIRLLAVRLFS